jgi:predicted MFS family arabinose efflux permease
VKSVLDDSVENPSSRSGVYRWYTLGLLLLVYSCTTIDRSILSVLVEPLKKNFGLSDSQVGMLAGLAFSVPFAIASLPLGVLVDRFNRRNILSAIVTIWSGATMLGSIAIGYPTLFAARMAVGAAEAGAHPACLSLLADIFPPRIRTTAVSIFSAGTSVGNVVLFFFGGWVLFHFGWRTVFFVAGVPGVTLALLIFLTFREPIRGIFDHAPREQQPKATRWGVRAMVNTLRLVLRSPPTLHVIIAHTLATGVQFSFVIWVVSFLTRTQGMASHTASYWVGLSTGIIQTAAALAIGPIADRWSGGDPIRLCRLPAAAAVMTGLAGWVMCLSPDGPLVLVALFIETASIGALLGPSYSLLLSVALPQARGSTMALARLVSMLIGNSAITYFTGAVSDAVAGPASVRVAIMATLAGQFWAALHYALAGRALKRGVLATSAVSSTVLS